MSRQELAEAVNAYLFATTERVASLDGNYVGKLERGEHRWPCAAYRQVFRAVLGASTDADLGFYIVRRTGDDDPATEDDPAVLGRTKPVGHRVGVGVGLGVAVPDVPAAQVIVRPGAAVTVVCQESEGLGPAIGAGPVQVLVGASPAGAAGLIGPVGVAERSAVAAGGARVYPLSGRRRAAMARRRGQAAGPGSIA